MSIYPSTPMKAGALLWLATGCLLSILVVYMYRITAELKIVTKQQQITLAALRDVQTEQKQHGEQITGILNSVIKLDLMFNDSSDLSALAGPVTIPEKIKAISDKFFQQQGNLEKMASSMVLIKDDLDAISSSMTEVCADLKSVETQIQHIKTDIIFLKIQSSR